MPTPQVNPFVNAIKISQDSQERLKLYLQQCKQLGYQNFNIRETMRQIDMEYAREVDFTNENIKARILNRAGDSNKFRNITVPVILPQVESAVTYQSSVFLTGVPIFGVVADPTLMGPAKQLETILDNQAIRGGWVDELIMFFRDGEKYNFGIVEAEWQREMLPGFGTDVTTSANAAKIMPIAWDGNVLNRWDPYNSFWDIRYEPADISKRGEFIGCSEMISRVELKKALITEPNTLIQNIKGALESPTPAITVSADSSILTYYIPQISPTALINPALLGQFNWMAWAGLEPEGSQINYRNVYMRTKVYARIIPSDFGIDVPAKNTPQIWKFIWINDQVLVYAQPVSNAFTNFPVFMSAPNRDGLSYQTKSLAQNSRDFQNVTSAMMNSIIHARRRAISDRVLYDPSRVSEAQINNPNPSAKIPVRPAAYGKPLQEAVYAFPYNDNQSQILFSEIGQLMQMADKTNGLNPARQGQFVKGNKTRREYDDTMANSTGRDQLKSLVYECQVFTPLKECLKNNVLEKQTPATMYSRELKAPVTIDPVELRKASLQFQVSDGLVPSEKVISGDVLQDALNVLGTAPAIAAGYNVAPLFSYLMKTQGADLSPFEKSPQQQAYEQASGQWQQAVQMATQQFVGAIKGVDTQQIPQLMQEFQKSLPPQPKPADFGYVPGSSQVNVNLNPTSTVMDQVQQLLNQTAQSTGAAPSNNPSQSQPQSQPQPGATQNG
jgi:hypothetical protein